MTTFSDYTFRVISVGAGDASVLIDKGPKPQTTVIDGGTVSRGGEKLFDALTEAGVLKPTLVVISHPDSEHRAGVLYVLEASGGTHIWNKTDPLVVVKNTALNEAKDKSEVATLTNATATGLGFAPYTGSAPLSSMEPFQWYQYDAFTRGGAKLLAGASNTSRPRPSTLLSHEWTKFEADWVNDTSPFNAASALHVHKASGILFTGDALAAEISKFKSTTTLPINLLKVPHHGSRRNCIDRVQVDWDQVSQEYLILHLLQTDPNATPIASSKISWGDEVKDCLDKCFTAARTPNRADTETDLAVRIAKYKADCQAGILPTPTDDKYVGLWKDLVTAVTGQRPRMSSNANLVKAVIGGTKRKRTDASSDFKAEFQRSLRDLSYLAEDLVNYYYPQKMAAFFKSTGAHNFTVSASGTQHGHPNEETVMGLLIAALDWPGSRTVPNADRVGRHILFTVINDEDRRKERIESAIGKLHTVKYPADPSKTYADVMLERINAGAANQVLAYLTISTEPWVDVDPTATTLGTFVKNPAQVEPVQIKALLDASASAYRSSIIATARTSPAVSRPARYKPKPLAFSHLPNMPPTPDAETSRKLAASMLAALPADGTSHQLSLLDYLRQFYPEVVPATGPQPNVPLLFVLGCCTSGPYQAVGVFSTLPRMLQVDTVAEASADLQASQVEVLTFTDGSYEVTSAKLVLPSTVSVWGTAAVGTPAFNVKNLEFLMTVDTTLRLIHLEAHGQATISGLPRPFDVVLGRRLVADGSLLRAHDTAAAAKITFRQEPMDWAALNVAFKGMFKGALGQQSSDMPAIVGGIASLGAGGFELEEIGLATGLRVCRVMGVIDTSRLTTSFSWSAVLPGDLGTALSSKVGIQGGTAELSMYSPAYQQVIGLALDNFVFTAPSGGAVSISLDRQPDAVSSTAPPTLDWLLCAKPAAGNAKPVTLADFAALLGPVGVATEGIPGLEAVLKSVSVKQLYIELDSANGAIKLEGISVKAEIAPLTLLPSVLALKDATDIDLSWSRGIDDTGYWAGSVETVMELFGSLDLPVILNLPTDYSYGGLSIQNPCRGSMPGLALQEVAKGFGWTLPTFTELDISKYLPLEVQLAEITLDVGPNDQGLVVAGVTVVLRVGEMNIAPFNLKEAELTISDWLQPLPDGTSAVSAQLTGVVGAGNDNVSFSLTYNDNPTPVTPALPRFLTSGTRVLPYPIPDPTASYRFGGSLTVLCTEQPDAMALPAATERLGLGISADDQLLHGSALSAFKPFAGSIAFDSADRWAVTLAMGERIPISSSAQLLGLKAVVKKQPEGAQFGVSASLAIGDWRLAVAAAYSRPDNLIAISVSAEDQGFSVLGAFSSDLASKYGLTVPTPGAPGNANPGLVSASVDLATDLQFSLRKFELQVQGRWTIGQIASVIGLPWPLANDFITLEGAALRYVPTDFQTPGGGPKLLAQFVVAASMDIPALHATKLNAAVVVSAGAGVAIQLSGTWKPIMGVEIDNAALAVKGGVGLLLSSAGRVFGTGFTITITASQGGMDFMAHADKINLGGILKSLVPDIPDFLFGFCKALSFAQVNVGYVNGAFTLLAVPDVLSSPELQAILKVTGFTQDDIHLSTGSGGTGTSLSVVKGLTLNLPAPFVGPAELHFSLAVSDKVPGSIMFSGSFAAGLDVFGQGVLHFELTAGVYVPQLLLYFKGATTAPFTLKAFPFITLDSLYLEATIDVEVEPPAPVELAFHSATQLFGATTNNVIKYDTLSNQFALLSDIEHAGVQQALASVGVNVDLSGFNLEMSQVKLSFAEKAVVVDKQPVPQGLFLGGDVSLFGLLDTTVKLQLTTSGATFGLTVDDTQLVKIAKQVSDEVQKALDAASDKVDSAKKDAQQKLEAAKQKVADAEAAVAAAQSAFDDAKQKAAAGLAAAQQALETSQAAFDAAEKSAKDAVDAAQRDVDSAQSAFDSAKAAATAALNNAQAQADAADRAFDDAKASVQGPLDSAQSAVNSLQSQLDGLSCDWLHPQDCAEEAALEPALEAAKVTLDGAQAAFNAVMNGAQAATKATADAALEAAQQAMQQVLNGSAYVALNTAKAALAAAQTAAQAVLSGSQAAALASAKTARDLAQAAADAVLNGAQAAALKTAEGVLEAANGVLTGAEATAAATLDLCARATKDLGHLLSLALTLFALLKLDLHFQLTPTLLAVHAAMDVSVEGRALPQLAFDLQLKDPLGQLVQLVAKGVVDGVRAAYDSLSSFL